MTTASNTAPFQYSEIQLAALTYQQSMQGLSSIAAAKASDSGVVALQPGQLSVVQMQAGKHYKLRKSGNPAQTPDDLIAVRHGDALHVRYADGSVVHFEDFYSTCTSGSVCSVNLAGDGEAGIVLSADTVYTGAVADDGLLVYAHGNPDVLMSMAQDQSALSSALRSVETGSTLTYLAPGPSVAMGLMGLLGLGALASASTSTSANAAVGADPSTLAEAALRKLKAAADANNASGSTTPPVAALTEADYTAALVKNVSNVAAINSALDSAGITAAVLTNTAAVQKIVDAYNAILLSADGPMGTTSAPITGEQYAAIGVTGVPTGSPTEGSALKLLDEVVDRSAPAAVNTVGKLQVMADAANHVLTAAGGTAVEANALTVADLNALGFTSVTADNIVAIRDAIKATPDANVDQQGELATIIGNAITLAGSELAKISAAAQTNVAGGASGIPALSKANYTAASVSGVNDSNVVAINSALDSAVVDASKTNTTPKVQAIVDAYNAIINAANSTAGSIPITADQFSAIGVTGVSGSPATEGSAIKLLDDVVDRSAPAAVATETLLQNMATAANHLMDAAGGTPSQAANLTASDLQALGINMGTLDIATVRTALQAVSSDNAVDTKGELQSLISNIAAPAPALSSTLSGVSDLDVSSNLVFTSSTAVNAGSGKIHIKDLGGAGYHGDVNNNSVDIDMTTAVGLGLVSFDATHTKITINPKWDLDLSSNYSIAFDAGAFVDMATGTHESGAVSAISFSTVAPGTHTATGSPALDAHASHSMDATGAVVVSGRVWLDIEGLGSILGGVTQLGDLSTGSYVLVAKNYATSPGGAGGDGTDGIRLLDTNVGVATFGANDIVYFDSQVNDISKQVFDGHYTTVVDGHTFGGNVGQNALDMATVGAPTTQASGARIMLGLAGNTGNQQYGTIYQDGSNHGWATDWHPASDPVIMA